MTLQTITVTCDSCNAESTVTSDQEVCFCPACGEPVGTVLVRDDQISPDLANELVEVLSEAGVEIANLDGSDNIVGERLQALRERIQQAELVA